MQTPVDDSGIFAEVSRSAQASLVLVRAPLKEFLARAKLSIGDEILTYGYVKPRVQWFPNDEDPDRPL
jgi:hypothetical protein